MSTLNVLEPNKTVITYSYLEDEDKGEFLVRTGVMPDISSVIHCLLHATSREYVGSTNRVKLAERIRESLGDKLQKKEWRDISTSLVAKIPFQDTLVALWKEVYTISLDPTKQITNREVKNCIKKSQDAYELLCKILSQKQLIEELLPKAFSKSADSNISVCKENISVILKETLEKSLSAFGKKLDSERKRYCHKKLEEIHEILCDEAEKAAMKEYETNFQKSMLEIDPTVVGLLAEKFNRDIYCLGSNRFPFEFCAKKDLTRNRKAVVLIRITDVHYEVMGRLKTGHIVQREFDANDPFIEKLYCYLYDRQKFASKWPRLANKLPADPIPEKTSEKKIAFSPPEQKEKDEQKSSEQKHHRRSRRHRRR
jgi:hypothetical protein